MHHTRRVTDPAAAAVHQLIQSDQSIPDGAQVDAYVLLVGYRFGPALLHSDLGWTTSLGLSDRDTAAMLRAAADRLDSQAA